MHATPIPAAGSTPLDSAYLTTRIRAEYIEMPGLSVTLAQAARLWDLDRVRCLDVLESLLNEGFLYRSRNSYLRLR